MRRFAKPRPVSQKRLQDRRYNLDPIYESEYQRRYDEIRLSLRAKKNSSKVQSRRRRRSSGAYAIVLTKTLLNEKLAYKIHIEAERVEEGGSDSAYIDFLKMIGAFDARTRLLRTGPFSAKKRPKPLPNVGGDFPELHSLLENLPKTRVASTAPVVDLSAHRGHKSEPAEERVGSPEAAKRSRYSIEIEEYPTMNVSESEDIVDLTACIDLWSFPKSMSSMAASMYSWPVRLLCAVPKESCLRCDKLLYFWQSGYAHLVLFLSFFSLEYIRTVNFYCSFSSQLTLMIVALLLLLQIFQHTITSESEKNVRNFIYESISVLSARNSWLFVRLQRQIDCSQPLFLSFSEEKRIEQLIKSTYFST